jgi:hypothetical protein
MVNIQGLYVLKYELYKRYIIQAPFPLSISTVLNHTKHKLFAHNDYQNRITTIKLW